MGCMGYTGYRDCKDCKGYMGYRDCKGYRDVRL